MRLVYVCFDRNGFESKDFSRNFKDVFQEIQGPKTGKTFQNDTDFDF
jgi:hypothetical protein